MCRATALNSRSESVRFIPIFWFVFSNPFSLLSSLFLPLMIALSLRLSLCVRACGAVGLCPPRCAAGRDLLSYAKGGEGGRELQETKRSPARYCGRIIIFLKNVFVHRYTVKT
jgi:hypothetical protein